LAVGDRREFSAFKRAYAVREDGRASIKFLIDNGLLIRDISQDQPVNENEIVSDKFHFTQPFMRFWFAFVSPYFKSVKDGDFKETKERFGNHKQEFFEFAFKKLAVEVVKKGFINDAIVEAGSYWDRSVQIDILAKTASGKIVAGICKYSTQKAKKSELAKLKEQCEAAQLNPDIFVIVSKSGFSSELKALKSDELKLFTMKSFSN
jgi:hypothetical protein